MSIVGRELRQIKASPLVTARVGLHYIKRKLFGGDEYDWKAYNQRYRAEVAHGRTHYTDDLALEPFTIHEGRLYLVADALPLHPVHRCVLEAVINLSPKSVAEIGCGGGKFVASLAEIYGPAVSVSGYDLDQNQLNFLRELYPAAAAAVPVRQLDISIVPIPADAMPEVVFLSTVLMHIQRPDAYRKALRNTLKSASRAAIILDNYTKHDYFNDLTKEAAELGLTDALWLYETQRAKAIVVSLTGTLRAPFVRLNAASQLSN